ncbi:neurotrophin 1 isoform X2 [Diachasma alloeum]|uniref:neurotrophin 1 isoform X2 n=1 Tax=Diachasma alloeum TaxID=454923 RepID=UPI0007384AAD|nr:neurotrophin 1 isoform X2 [Diachasma alloeum]
MCTVDRILFISLIFCISPAISQTFPDGASNLPESEYDGSSTREAHTPRARLRPLGAPTQRTPTGGRIIFPGDPEASKLASRMSPDLTAVCSDSTYCENVPNYPKEFIMNALKARQNEFKHLATVDPPFDVGQRIGVSEYETLCDIEVAIVYPQAAKTTKDEWLFIVNTEYKEDNEVNFQQGFRIEKCINPNSTCKIVDHAAASSGYDTVCKQQHITRQALGVKNGELAEGIIMLPVSCCCYLKYRGDVFPRMGGSDAESSAHRKGTSSRRH